MRVSFAGDRRALSAPTVRRIVTTVLEDHAVDRATLTVTFMSLARMRSLNRRTFGHDRPTDVIAFPLPHAEELVGDVYVCPTVARRSARHFKVPPREELIRLVIHGLLHVLGKDHPPGASRERSPMWRLQERYVNALTGGSS